MSNTPSHAPEAAHQVQEVEKVQALPRVDALTRVFSVFSKLVLWTVVLGCVLAGGLAAVVHGYALPRLNQWTPKLEALIAEQTQLPVRIGSLEAGDKGWLPVLRLRDVAVLDAQQQTRLHVPLVELHVSLVSLLRGGFEQLYVEGLDVQVLRTADGKMSVAGLAIEEDADNADGIDPELLQTVLDWFFEQPEFFLNKSRVQWVDKTRNVPPVHANDVQLVVRNGLVYKRLYITGAPDAQWGKRYVVKAQLQQSLLGGANASWLQSSGELYAHFPMLDADLLSAYAAVPHVQIERGMAAVRAWVQVREGALEQTTADVYIHDALAYMHNGKNNDTAPDGNNKQKHTHKHKRELRLDKATARLAWQGSVPMFARQSAGVVDATEDGLDSLGGLGNWKLEQLNVVSAGQPLLEGVQAGGSQDANGKQTYALQMEKAADLRAARRLSEVLLPSLLDDAQFVQVRDAMRALDMQGAVALEHAECTVEGGTITQYHIKGKLADAQWQAQKLTEADKAMMRARDVPEKWPGIAGLQVDFDMTQEGGTARVRIDKGHADVVGVFEQPHIPIDKLDGKVEWTFEGERFMGFALREAAFETPDGAGVANVAWRMAEQPESDSGSSSNSSSYLDIHGTIRDANPARVHRYLPVTVRQEVRDYVKAAIVGGHAPKGDFQIRGLIKDFPWVDGGAAAADASDGGRDKNKGIFHIGTDAQDLQFAFAPPHLAVQGDAPWPTLQNVAGRFDITGESITVRDITAQYDGMELTHGHAHIADYNNTVVEVQATAQGDLRDALRSVRSSPLQRITNGQLDEIEGDGVTQLQLGLQLPISNINATTVQGTVTLQGNRVKLLPSLPALDGATGTVAFSEQHLNVSQVQAQWLGGAVTLHGGTQEQPTLVMNGGQEYVAKGFNRPMRFDIQGQANVDGLYTLAGVASSSPLVRAKVLAGAANYQAQLHVNDRNALFNTHWLVQSDLQGLAVALPKPLGKAQHAQKGVLVRGGVQRVKNNGGTGGGFENAVLVQYGQPLGQEEQNKSQNQSQNQNQNPNDGAAYAYYQWRSVAAGAPDSVRGTLVLGKNALQQSTRFAESTVQLPDTGVVAQVDLSTLDATAWQKVLAVSGEGSVENTGGGNGTALLAWLPQRAEVYLGALHAGGVTFDAVDMKLHRSWDEAVAQTQSKQIAGELRYAFGGSTPTLTARLKHLYIPSGLLDADDGEEAAQVAVPSRSVVRRLPRLDVVVDDVRWGDTTLGKLTLAGQPDKNGDKNGDVVGAAWKLEQLRLDAPRAQLDASGYWSLVGLNAVPSHQTNLRYTLKLNHVGNALADWGLPNVIDGGKGTLAGNMEWAAAPWQPDYASMRGAMNVQASKGRFLQADPGAAKLLWFFSLQALPKRLTLDFGDAIEKGVAFKEIKGDIAVENGIARTEKLRLRGPDIDATMRGETDLKQRTQNLQVEVVPHIDARGASLVAAAINPAVGVGTFIAQSVLGKSLSKAAAQRFSITGTWDAPVVEKKGSDKEGDKASNKASSNESDNDKVRGNRVEDVYD